MQSEVRNSFAHPIQFHVGGWVAVGVAPDFPTSSTFFTLTIAASIHKLFTHETLYAISNEHATTTTTAAVAAVVEKAYKF